jgi:hypothetical protein
VSLERKKERFLLFQTNKMTTTASELHDALALSSLLSDSQPAVEEELKYANRQLQYLTPTTNSYNLSVSFDSVNITDRWTDWTNSYLRLPLTITYAANLVPAPVWPATFFKSSALSALSGVVVKTATGQPLLDERQAGLFANHLRLAMERDEDWLRSVAPEIHFSMDRPGQGMVTGLKSAAEINIANLSPYTALPAIGVAANDGSGTNVAFNLGAKERQQYLMASCYDDKGVAPSFAGTTLNCVLRIPLSCIHDFFRQMSFPIIGCRLQYEFYLTNSSNTNFSPVCVGSAEAPSGAPLNIVAAGGTPTIAVTAGATPRLYYHAVQMKAEQNALAAQKLARGFSKRIVFRQYDLFKDISAQQNIPDGTTFQYEVTRSAVAAQKLWIMCYPNPAAGVGLINGSSWPSVLTTGPYGLTNIQCSLNNTPYLNNPISTLDEQYEMLKRAGHIGADSGDVETLIPYQRFKLTSRILPIDLSRAHSLSADPNAPLSIRVDATTQFPTNGDIVYVLERLVALDMDFTAQEVRVRMAPAMYK